jgi:precorrin-6B C5,15-methyltransferase / cobalt-precorrin-6B C5,C15-methyltransferase
MGDPVDGASGNPGPWLSLIGIGEQGLGGLSSASRAALEAAEVVFGGPRHLALAAIDARGRAWPVPFDIAAVLTLRGRRVAVLASGDPFWFGVGGTLMAQLARREWQAFPGPSTFALAASALGWRLETTACLGLHAAPFTALRTDLHEGRRLIGLLRDAAAPGELARWLVGHGFGASRLHVLERLGGPAERIRSAVAEAFALDDIVAPVAVGIEARGAGLSCVPGRPDDVFRHDGQITRPAVRAISLANLAPRWGERLWDIGAGSGAIAIEWCLASRGEAVAIEARPDRVENLCFNLGAFGLEARVQVVEGRAPAALVGLPPPDAVFVGGGANEALLEAVWAAMPAGARLVVNAVTLETEALLQAWSQRWGGTLLRLEMAEAAPLGRMRGWVPARPIVQWSVSR